MDGSRSSSGGGSDGSDSDGCDFQGCAGEDDEAVEALMERDRTFVLPNVGRPLTIIQDFIGIEGTGGTVWRASTMLARYCCTDLLPTIRGASVLEIGAGLGLVSTAAWHLGASNVVATDINDDTSSTQLLALLRRNITANCTTITTTTSSVDASATGTTRRPPAVMQLWWGNDTELQHVLREGFAGGAPDVVLACDVLAWPELYPQLSQTLRGAGGGRATIVLAHQYRAKEREIDFINSFSDAYNVELAHQEDHRLVIYKLSPRAPIKDA